MPDHVSQFELPSRSPEPIRVELRSHDLRRALPGHPPKCDDDYAAALKDAAYDRRRP